MTGRAWAWWLDLTGDTPRMIRFTVRFGQACTSLTLAAVHLIGLVRFGRF